MITISSVFFWYELSLFLLPFFGIDAFNITVSLLIQLMPIVFGVAIFVFLPKLSNIEKQKTQIIHKVTRELLFQLPSIAILGVISVSFARFGWGSMAFAMSGDARNHVWFSRFIVEQKGLDSTSSSFYPVLPDSMVALTRSALEPFSSLAENKLTLDLISLGIMTVTVLIFMSQVHILVGKSLLAEKHPLAMISILVLASLPLGALVSKVALGDGFYPALFASLFLQLFCLSGWLYFESRCDREKTLLLCSFFLLVPLIASTWTILLIFPALCFLLFPSSIKQTLFSALKNQKMVQVAFILSGALLFLNLYPLVSKGAAAGYVKLPGAITLPSPILFFTILTSFFIYLSSHFIRRSNSGLKFLNSFLIVTVATFAYLASLQDNNNYWNYYPAKFTWIAFITILPFLIGIAVRDFAQSPRILSIILIPVFVLAPWSMTNSPWIKFDAFISNRPQSIIYSGWYSPSSISVNQVLNYGVENVPTVFWDLQDPSGDRLANFWLATYLPAKFDNPALATNLLRDWAYYEIPGQIDSLCDLLENSELRWKIYTKNINLTEQIADFCFKEVSQNNVILVKK